MKHNNTIAKICQMPRDFSTRGDVSMNQLLQESGYPGCREEITETLIQQYVQTHREIIVAWQRYSDDQRCAPSWFFRDKVVGYVAMSGNTESQKEYLSDLEACAAYLNLF